MKYYYISHEGPFRNNLIIGKDADRILRDKNKIIITRIKGRFHVLICRNGVFEKEKHILSYFELVSFLKRNTFNAYFINVNSETAYYINSYVKKDDEYCKEINDSDYHKSFFTIDKGNVLKLEANINREVIKDKLNDIYYEEIKDESRIQTIGLIDLVDNSELFELYNYPINERAGKFTVPDYSYANPNLFYMLSGIYSKDGDSINLTGDDLSVLYLAKVLNEDIVDEIVDNIDINILDKYDLDEFNKSVEFIDLYKKQEKDVYIKLQSMRRCLNDARRNMKYVNSLGLLKKLYEKEVNDELKKKYRKEGSL